MGEGGESPYPQSRENIRVLSTSHEVNFPDEVRFTLEAESDAQIIDVTLFYRLADQDTTVYGYPQFSPAARVSTDFKVKTGGSSFIPGGVDIRYHYLIRDRAGNTLVTDEDSLLYIDPRYDWQEVSEGGVAILSHDIPLDRVSRVMAEVSEKLEPVKELFGIEEPPLVRGVIVNNRLEAARSFPPVSRAAGRGHLYSGFAFSDYGVFALVGLNSDGIVHEATHLLLREAVDTPVAKIPSWLNEGLAMYFEQGSVGRQRVVEDALRRGSLMRLRNMNTVPGRPRDVQVFYAQSRSVVNYMMDRLGLDRMAALLDALREGERIDLAVQRSYGLSLEEMEVQWKADLAGETPLAPRPDLGTVAVSALVSGAFVIAIAVTAVRWLKRLSMQSEPDDTAR